MVPLYMRFSGGRRDASVKNGPASLQHSDNQTGVCSAATFVQVEVRPVGCLCVPCWLFVSRVPGHRARCYQNVTQTLVVSSPHANTARIAQDILVKIHSRLKSSRCLALDSVAVTPLYLLIMKVVPPRSVTGGLLWWDKRPRPELLQLIR